MTKAERRIARIALTRTLIRYDYNYAAVARAAQVSRELIRTWDARGYVSAAGAYLLGDHNLRPDITDWEAIARMVKLNKQAESLRAAANG